MKNNNEEYTVGGQAIVEGVMMRSPDGISVAVRKQNGEIVIDKKKYTPYSKRYKILGIPVIRGFVTLIETLVIGMKALSFSADVAIEEEEERERQEKGEPELTLEEKKKSDKKRTLALAGTMIFAFALAILLFTVLPYVLTEVLQKQFGVHKDSVSFNLIAGIIRIIIFLLYLWAITFMKDIQRIFQYHGAEHKSIFAFEKGENLEIENAKKYTTHHPRCGTSFLLIVMISAIIIYVITDTILAAHLGHRPSIWLRFAVHIPLLPLIAGISYELIKLSGKVDQDHWLAKILLAPGLGLQRITTKEPDNEQLEVALAALKEVLTLGDEKS
jgi:uncharacterized protein YqhQ